MILPANSQPIPEPTKHITLSLQGALDMTQIPFPPILDLDDLQELADRLEDFAHQLDREARDLEKRAKVLRQSAVTIKSHGPSTSLDHSDKGEEGQ